MYMLDSIHTMPLWFQGKLLKKYIESTLEGLLTFRFWMPLRLSRCFVAFLKSHYLRNYQRTPWIRWFEANKTKNVLTLILQTIQMRH